MTLCVQMRRVERETAGKALRLEEEASHRVFVRVLRSAPCLIQLHAASSRVLHTRHGVLQLHIQLHVQNVCSLSAAATEMAHTGVFIAGYDCVPACKSCV